MLAALLDRESDGVHATEDQVEIGLAPCGLRRVARERLQGRRRSRPVAKRFSKLLCRGKRCNMMAIGGNEKKASTITYCWPLAVDGRLIVVVIGQGQAIS